MSVICLHEKQEIEHLLEKNPYLHLYSLGDLDDLLWPYTIWYGYRSDNELKTVVLVYAGPQLPTVIGLSRNHEDLKKHLNSLQHLLPVRFNAHLNHDMEAVFHKNYNIESGLQHYKMAFLGKDNIPEIDTGEVICLDQTDLPALQSLYDECYPGNWFDPYMLQTNQYFGIKERGRILTAAGVHVFSQRYKVAAIGNIITRTDYRNRGYGSKVTAKLCESLSALDLRIGLNVNANNSAAVACYNKSGFQIIAEYDEYLISRK